MSNRIPNKTRVSAEHKHVKKEKNTDIGKVLKFFAIWAILGGVSYVVKKIVLDRIAQNMYDYYMNPFFTFQEVHNTGAAFNLFPNNTQALIVAATICMAIMVLIVLTRSAKLSQSVISAMSALCAGMTLNTLERVYDGYVTDYIYFTFFKEFPVFNVSDIMIVVGAFMLVISLIFNPRD